MTAGFMGGTLENARDHFLEIIAQNRVHGGRGIYSVCSAHAAVLEACFRQAQADGSILLVESTSNQVDQEGGYTGMTPADFIRSVNAIANKVGFPEEMILMGGDHLGPNKWRGLPAGEAMDHAKVLVTEYVRAGFSKIHLDASMFCADDKGDPKKPLDDHIVAARTAMLCRSAEDAWRECQPGGLQPVYIIGTEVPPPGGAEEEEDKIIPTRPEDVARTIEITRQSFDDHGLSEAWERVVGVVVQPGVEYGDDVVFPYQREQATGLSRKILEYDRLVYEAHSTDYQSAAGLRRLVEDHFCILKVGPWLTFAFREALFALESMEVEILGAGNGKRSRLKDTIEKVMVRDPRHWGKYYSGARDQQSFKRKYSFSDRVRYYWPDKSIDKAKNRLIDNLRGNRLPLSLISQFMPSLFPDVLDGKLGNDPLELIATYIRIICRMYARACGLSGG